WAELQHSEPVLWRQRGGNAWLQRICRSGLAAQINQGHRAVYRRMVRGGEGVAEGQSAATIASSPSVSAAGPGCRISGDLISTIRSLSTAGIWSHPGRRLILSGTTFLPHQDARIRSEERRV